MATERISRTSVRFQRVLRITLAWVILACVAAVFEHTSLLTNGVPSHLIDHIDDRFLTALLAGFLGGGLYIFVLRDRWRKLAYFRAAGIMAVLLFAMVLAFSVFLPAAARAHLSVAERLFSFQLSNRISADQNRFLATMGLSNAALRTRSPWRCSISAT